ncbi:hypothetical protein [Sphingomonas sp.]|uniref:hypothetical protein n=1 Tax=Sphingomonas sp. TaxID=28214 RepID=UPI001EC4AC23|nr:hypothetical protein [Sphingomonas sp.]MBX3594878.1 hypothetical protein [Sphingomonas sp.]
MRIVHRPLALTLALVAASACSASDGEGGATNRAMAKAPSAATCAAGERTLSVTGLCQRAAAAMLPPGSKGTPMEGCEWVVRETPFATETLLYRTLHCARGETNVEFQVGNHQSQLVYASRADGGAATDADGAPLVLAQVFAGDPDGRARALWETRDSMQDPAAAKRCDVRPPYQPEGLPADAVIIDIARARGDLERDDAAPECGPFGYNPAGGSIDFWRTSQGYAWFFRMGTDLWDVDPGSFTIVEKRADGSWRALPDPIAGPEPR